MPHLLHPIAVSQPAMLPPDAAEQDVVSASRSHVLGGDLPPPPLLPHQTEQTNQPTPPMADAIYDQIEIEDMTFDPALQIYHYPCPCGDRFEISIDDLRDGENVAVCPSCSLMIEVIFEPVCICPEGMGRASEWALTRTVVGGFTGCEGDARDDGDRDGGCCGGLRTLWELVTLISTPPAGPTRSLSRSRRETNGNSRDARCGVWCSGGGVFFFGGRFCRLYCRVAGSRLAMFGLFAADGCSVCTCQCWVKIQRSLVRSTFSPDSLL